MRLLSWLALLLSAAWAGQAPSPPGPAAPPISGENLAPQSIERRIEGSQPGYQEAGRRGTRSGRST